MSASFAPNRVVLTPMLASGHFLHQRVMCAGSRVASVWNSRISGGSFAPDLSGKTWKPAFASSSALSSIVKVHLVVRIREVLLT